MPSFPTRLLVTVLLLAALTCTAIEAGTIRDDRKDIDYVRLSENPALAAVGSVTVANQPHCSATLIAPQWVLCAAHCVISPGGTTYTTQSFSVGGKTQTVTADNIFIHPQWVATGLNVGSGEGDIAMFRLPAPVAGVSPIVTGRSRDEVGQVGFSVGYGRTGTGINGQTVASAERRAGQNVIDTTSTTIAWPNTTPIPLGNDKMLLYDFDSPQRNYSTIGSPVPLNLEYDTAQGDSGGPLLVFRSGRYIVVGICSGGMGPVGRDVATYGDTSTFTRVSSYSAWISSVMSGSQPSLQTMIRTGNFTANSLARARLVAIDRARVLESLGWRETAFMPTPPLTPGEQDEVFSWLVPARDRGRASVLMQEARPGTGRPPTSPMPTVECLDCATMAADVTRALPPAGQSILAR